jgi:hypothetical protein
LFNNTLATGTAQRPFDERESKTPLSRIMPPQDCRAGALL